MKPTLRVWRDGAVWTWEVAVGGRLVQGSHADRSEAIERGHEEAHRLGA